MRRAAHISSPEDRNPINFQADGGANVPGPPKILHKGALVSQTQVELCNELVPSELGLGRFATNGSFFTMRREHISTSSGLPPPWSPDELVKLRAHLKSGSSLLDTAHSLQREPGDVEAKISELFASPRPAG
jgi:hypothetical protein